MKKVLIGLVIAVIIIRVELSPLFSNEGTNAPVMNKTEKTAQNKPQKWIWTKDELQKIKQLEKQVTKKNKIFAIEGENWVVNTDISAQFTAELALFMETFSKTFSTVFNLRSATVVPLKPTVMVFSSPAQYGKMFPDGSRGQYKYKWNDEGKWTEFHLYTFIQFDYERIFCDFYYPILLHEGTHLLLRGFFGKKQVLACFDEGISSYFQSWDLRSGLSDNLKNRVNRSPYIKYLPEFKSGCGFPKLEALLNKKPDEWNPDKMGPKANQNYALAESFIDFLLSSEKELFNQTFQRLVKEADESDILNKQEIERIEPLWHKHITNIINIIQGEKGKSGR